MARPLPTTILYRDPHFLAIDKPAGVASVRERWTDDDSALVRVWETLRRDDPDAEKPRVVHRLDKETTGVLLFAVSREAARSLSRQFRERGVEKSYLALVRGTPPRDSGRIEVLLAADPQRPGHSRVVPRRGKPSITEWRRVEAFSGFSLLEVRPRTGRMHQIRVSLAHHGYPLLVDPAYRGGESLLLSSLKPGYKRKKDREERPLISRVSLHAARIRLAHPVTGEGVEVEAPLPRDFELSLKYLRKFRPIRER
jgi:RluA family pseudouridine synthase